MILYFCPFRLLRLNCYCSLTQSFSFSFIFILTFLTSCFSASFIRFLHSFPIILNFLLSSAIEYRFYFVLFLVLITFCWVRNRKNENEYFRLYFDCKNTIFLFYHSLFFLILIFCHLFFL